MAKEHWGGEQILLKIAAGADQSVSPLFSESRRGADIHIDLGNMSARNSMAPLIHIGEVLQKKITNTKTSQDAVREILMANPGVMTTPSPDPKWNRK